MSSTTPALTLEVADYKNAYNWYWRLHDAKGNFLADHAVCMNPGDFEYRGFVDLPSHLAQSAHGDEARLVKQVGEWMGTNFYGPIGEKILDEGTPAVVRVKVPAEASGLLYRPWELGYVRGKPLALQDVSLVFEVIGETASVRHVEVGDRLRILAVFSLPVDASALNLRQERYELSRAIGAIGQQNRAIELRVLQYGVTRQTLREVLEEGDGWDMVHFSGHGLAAHLILETASGKLDMVPSHEIVDLLKPSRGRLKWVTLSACLSAAATVNETRRWLGLEPVRFDGATDGTTGEKAGRELQTVARALVQNLDCAVLAMRYPVGDQFAIELCRDLLQGVLKDKQPLTRALQLALSERAKQPLDVATPTLFGRHAADLLLSIPPGDSPVRLGLSHFPPEPERFVGRVGLLSSARQALAPESPQTGVLFYGMSGAGKTACAKELAYQYQDIDRFQKFVWFQAPKEGDDISSALAAFATQWDIQVAENAVPMVAIASAEEEKFRANLPRLSKFLEQRSVLIVIDNIESLLRADGKWRDPRWEKLLEALLGHHGFSRLVLTSRVRPYPETKKLLALPVHSLSLDETMLLARQSPNLGKLLDDAKTRELVIRTLRMVQGHPKLLELAEGQAAAAEGLAAHLDRAQEASGAGAKELDAFFQTGESALEADAFLRQLSGWTRSVVGSLSEAARPLFSRLCCLEEEDREKRVIELLLKALWKDAAGLPELVTAGLVDSEYRIHPGVAEAGRDLAGPELRSAVDRELAELWTSLFGHAQKNEAQGMGGMLVRAGRSAVPYLMRLSRWTEASTVLEQVIARDGTPATLAESLPLMQRIADATRGTPQGLEDAAVVGVALWRLGRVAEAEQVMAQVERDAAKEEQYLLASSSAGLRVNLRMMRGQFDKALEAVERQKDYDSRAGLGRWTRLGTESRRLQILSQMGRYKEVFTEVQNWRGEIKDWAETGEQKEAVDVWNVREVILDAGLSAAIGLELWEDALSLNAEITDLTRSRGATELELARTEHNDYSPLLRLKRYGEARDLLFRCLGVFKRDGTNEELGMVYSALASLEVELQHPEQSVRHETAALRYRYATGDPDGCGISHFNLAIYLMRTNAEARLALAHRTASAIIRYQTGEGRLASTINSLRRYLAGGSRGDVPASFDEICALVEQIEGVRFRELFSALPPRAATGDEALRAVLEMART